MKNIGKFQKELKGKSRWETKEDILRHAIKLYEGSCWDLPIMKSEAEEKLKELKNKE